MRNAAKTVLSPEIGPRARSVFSSASKYCESLLWIRDKSGVEIPLRWNNVQRLIQRKKREAVLAGRPHRFLIPKARRLGVTTQEQAFSFALVANHKGQQAVTIADTSGKSKRIFMMVDLFHEKLPEELKPHRKSENSQVLNFDKLRSQFFIGTAGAVSFGRGDTLQRVHGSEVAYWLSSRDQHLVENLIAGLTEAASHGEVVLESTANGNSGWWFDACTAAASGQGEWTIIFIPWFLDPNLALAATETEIRDIMNSLDDREKWLVEVHRLSAQQIKWRRAKRSERAMRRLFPQEYPEILEESFIASELGYFDAELISEMARTAEDPIKEDDGLTIWKNPVEKMRYVIGADVAEGVPGGDFSAGGILRVDTGEQVARLHGRWRPEDFAQRLVKAAKIYNGALIGCERNNHGHSCLNTLTNVIHWPRLYYERVINERRKATRKLGWSTDQLTRPIMLDDLRNAMLEGSISVNDRLFLGECAVFEDDGTGHYEARAGHHDDLVIAWSIAWQVRSRGLAVPTIIRL